MALSRKTQLYLIIFDLLILAFIIVSFIRDYYPINRPVFWAAAVIEIGLGFLTYRFWMHSILGKEYRSYRVRAFLFIVIGVFFPIFFYAINIDYLRPAGNTDLFFVFTGLTLLIYSSFIIDNYLESHGIQSK